MKRVIGTLLIATSLVVGCGQGKNKPRQAVGFITENTYPEGARVTGDNEIYRDKDGRPYNYPLLHSPIPEFKAHKLNGDLVQSSDFLGKWTVLDVWGIWCPDCITDAPNVADLASRLANDPELNFISMHTAPSYARRDGAFGKYGSVQAYFDAMGYSYPTIFDYDASVKEAFHIPWVPSYLLIDPEGVVRGYRADFHVARENPVEQFLEDVRGVIADFENGSLPQARPNPPAAVPYEIYRDPRLSIGPSGALGVSGPLKFDLAALKQSFDGYTVTAGEEMAEGLNYPVFYVSKSDNSAPTVLTLWGDAAGETVSLIATDNQEMSGPARGLIGQSKYGDMPEHAVSRCDEGVDELSDHLICWDPASDENVQFARVFGPPADFEGYYPEAPDAIRVQGVLKEFRLGLISGN